MLRLKRNAGRWAALFLGTCLVLLLMGGVLQSPAQAAEAEWEVKVGFDPSDQVIQIPEGDTTGEYAIALLSDDDGTAIAESPGTGDNSQTVLWAAIMLVSLCCVVLCIVLMGKKKRKPADDPEGDRQSENGENKE